MTDRATGFVAYLSQPHDLRPFLDAADIERAATGAAHWIKTLRHLPVEGVPLRDRFTYRGDSLWWFAELYLHKQGVIDQLFRTALALEALYRRDKPTSLTFGEGNAVLALLAPQVAQRFGFSIQIAASPASTSVANLRLDLKSRFYTWSALASRLRTRPRATDGRGGSGGTAAFVHSAFWRKPITDADGDEGQEGYIGAVLQALHARAEARPVRLIGVGPRTNFKARRWWHAIVPSRAGAGEIPVEPIERFASWDALAGARAIWRDRFALERALLGSDAIRAHATILGYDVWPIIAEELRGVARLQFPWSARAMDEAAAAMNALRPNLVVTYAEAGGWGRALMLEARRRGIPSVGLQHGFIYRHWLNYQHEADEMLPAASTRDAASLSNAVDRGFPRPDLTLVYDGYAARHLTTAGSFPEAAVRVTGSPALDGLVAAVSRVDDAERARIRVQLGAPIHAAHAVQQERAAPAAPRQDRGAMRPKAASPSDAEAGARDREPGATREPEHLIVLVTKFTQVREALPALLQAVSTLDNVRLVIKPHPAETPEPYISVTTATGARRVSVAPASLDLARLLAVARLLVTVNSTVAIDAIALGLPALVVALPNNLSPFVEAGVMADGGSHATADSASLAATIQALTADEGVRARLLARARAFAAQYAMQPDGRAAERAAEAMAGIMSSSRGGRAT